MKKQKTDVSAESVAYDLLMEAVKGAMGGRFTIWAFLDGPEWLERALKCLAERRRDEISSL